MSNFGCINFPDVVYANVNTDVPHSNTDLWQVYSYTQMSNAGVGVPQDDPSYTVNPPYGAPTIFDVNISVFGCITICASIYIVYFTI